MDGDINSSSFPERRRNTRINCQYPAIVQGSDIYGNEYEVSAEVSNLSVSGLYLWTNRPIEPGENISVVIHLIDETKNVPAPEIVTNGIVTRKDQQFGIFGIALMFKHYQFL